MVSRRVDSLGPSRSSSSSFHALARVAAIPALARASRRSGPSLLLWFDDGNPTPQSIILPEITSHLTKSLLPTSARSGPSTPGVVFFPFPSAVPTDQARLRGCVRRVTPATRPGVSCSVGGQVGGGDAGGRRGRGLDGFPMVVLTHPPLLDPEASGGSWSILSNGQPVRRLQPLKQAWRTPPRPAPECRRRRSSDYAFGFGRWKRTMHAVNHFSSTCRRSEHAQRARRLSPARACIELARDGHPPEPGRGALYTTQAERLQPARLVLSRGPAATG